MVQDRRVRQRLDRRHAHKCRQTQVDGPNLIAVALEVGSEEGVILPIEGFHVLERSRARNLLRKDTVQIGIDAMSLDRHSHDLTHRLLYRERCDLRQRATDDVHELLVMAIHDGSNQRLLAGEILIQRANTHARLLSDTVGAGFVESLREQNASSRLDQGVDRRA